MNQVLRGFLGAQLGGVLLMGVLCYISLQADRPSPLSSYLKIWAGYTLIFGIFSLVELIRRRRR